MKKALLAALLIFSACVIAARPQVDLTTLFAEAGEGEVIVIPSGSHTIDAPLQVKSWQVIYGNNAVIEPSGSFPVFDFTGASRVTSYNLRTHEATQQALLLSRGVDGHGAQNKFYDCWLEGLTEINSEGNTFTNCTFVTRGAEPALVYNGSNTTGTWRDCIFLNYGTEESVPLVQLGQTTSGLVFAGGYMYLGMNGTAFEVTGAASGMTFRDIRVEGDGAESLFLDNVGGSILYWYSIERIHWTIDSDYMIHAPRTIYESVLDFTWGVNNAARYIHADGAGVKIWRCRIYGNKADWITQTDGAQVRMNHMRWTGGEPLFTGPNDNHVEWESG